MKKFLTKIKNKAREVVIKNIVKSDGSDDAVIPIRGFVLTIIFFCSFVIQLMLGLFALYISHVVYPQSFNPIYHSLWYNLVLVSFAFDLCALISGGLLYLSFPKEAPDNNS